MDEVGFTTSISFGQNGDSVPAGAFSISIIKLSFCCVLVLLLKGVSFCFFTGFTLF